MISEQTSQNTGPQPGWKRLSFCVKAVACGGLFAKDSSEQPEFAAQIIKI